MLYHTENPHGGDIYSGTIQYDFSENTNPYGIPAGVLQAMQEALPQLKHYPDPYCRRLVQAIAEHDGVPKEYVLCGNGAAELIGSFCDALRPKTALEPAPTFSEYGQQLARAGCTVHTYPLREEKGFLLDEGFLDAARQLCPEVIFLCTPNNPTGRLIDPALLRQLLELCSAQHTRLFLDECFLDLAEGGVSMKPYLTAYPELVILKAYTKSYALAGVRLGYMLCSDAELLTRISRTTQPWNVSVLAQAAGVAALREQAFLTKTRALIREERPRLQAQLAELGFRVCPSDANYLLFRGPAGLCPPLRKLGVALRNCDNYEGLTPGWYRCAVRLPEENEALIRALSTVLEEEEAWQRQS